MIVSDKTASADWIYSVACDKWFTIVPTRAIGTRRTVIRWIDGSESLVRSGWLQKLSLIHISEPTRPY